MSEFRFQFEWEESPRVRAPELAATWARLEIYADGQSITKVEAKRTQSVRTGIYVPLFPIAEWIVANWWFLWEEWRTDSPPSRHNLLAAREGFVLPDLTVAPTETKVELLWRPVSTASAAFSSDVIFLSAGSIVLPKQPVKEEFRRLVESVLERLSSRQVRHSYLASEWRAILDAEQDAEQKAFCERSARLGCDPFDVTDAVAAQIEHLGAPLPEPVADDFCDAIPLAQLESGAEAVKGFIDSALATRVDQGRWRDVREALHPNGAEAPWRDGYNEARTLRARLGTSGPITTELDDFLIREFGSLQITEFHVASRIEAITAPTRTEAPVFGFRSHRREESRRFILCRALSDFLISGMPSLVTRGATEHQQRNRAFAVDFLAPADSLRQRITGALVGEEDVEELAQEFRVSELVIRHQIQNHEISRIAA